MTIFAGGTMFILYSVRLISIVYVLLGVLGFLPVEGLNPVHHQGVGARYLFNLVAINTAHNFIHLAIGLSGLWAARRLEWARWWGKVTGIVLLAVFVIGMVQAAAEGFPYDQLLLGVVVLNSPGHTLHLATGLIALYLGFVRPAERMPMTRR
jgi:hypothetical protein